MLVTRPKNRVECLNCDYVYFYLDPVIQPMYRRSSYDLGANKWGRCVGCGEPFYTQAVEDMLVVMDGDCSLSYEELCRLLEQ